MPKKDNFYSQTPVVSAKKIAGINPFGGPGIGAGTPATVPKTKGTMSQGLGNEPKHFFRHHLRPHHQKGNLRLSGHPGAHQVGQVKGVTKYPEAAPAHPAKVKPSKMATKHGDQRPKTTRQG